MNLRMTIRGWCWAVRMKQTHPAAVRLPTHLTLAERAILYEHAGLLGDAPVLEIGSYVGASACTLAAGLRDQRRHGPLICVDTWQNQGMAEGDRDTWEAFIENTTAYRDLIVPIRGRSHELAQRVMEAAKQPLALVFFDGDHSEEGVAGDWRAYRPLLAPGAIIFFHDIGWAEGVKRVVPRDVEPCLRWTKQLPNMIWGEFRG